MNKKASIALGPGSHQELIVSALRKKFDAIQVFSNWPAFKVELYKNKQIISEHKPLLYNPATKIVWKAWNMFPFKSTNWHHAYNLELYDRFVSKNIFKDSELFIGWSQASLNSIKRSVKLNIPVLLEHPMVHVNTWTAIMQEEYERYGNESACQYNMFSPSMIKKMQEEYSYAGSINVLSNYAFNSFIKNGIPGENLHITLPGIDTKLFYPKNNSRTEKFILIYVGRIDLLKGVHYLLEAFEKLHLKNAELWLVGDIKDEIKHILPRYEGIYKHFPYQNKKHLIDLYNQANVLVLPSVQEAFGMVILEAMSCGIPVIATETTGAPDIISDGQDGFVVKSRSVISLQEKIAYLYEKREEQEKMGMSARKKINANFDTSHYIERFSNLIDMFFSTK